MYGIYYRSEVSVYKWDTSVCSIVINYNVFIIIQNNHSRINKHGRGLTAHPV